MEPRLYAGVPKTGDELNAYEQLQDCKVCFLKYIVCPMAEQKCLDITSPDKGVYLIKYTLHSKEKDESRRAQVAICRRIA